ncbi:MAG: Ig domain-containing protein [Eubacterium sp.]|nr:Ig domain-containing protein [Eubacterium sp.]
MSIEKTKNRKMEEKQMKTGKRNRKVLSMGLVLALVLSTFLGVYDKPAEAAKIKPYRTITNAAEFNQFLKDLEMDGAFDGKLVEITQDIDISANMVDNIYSSSSMQFFNGVLDGKGHTISGINTTSNCIMDIGKLGEVKNLIIKSATIKSSGYVGPFRNYGGTISNCFVLDSSIESTHYAGGICGYIHYGQILNCCSINNNIVSGNETGTAAAGGIVGESAGCFISNCCSSSSVTGMGLYAGGIVGYLDDGTTSIYNCFNLSDLKARSSKGGLVGGVGSCSGVASSCYWAQETCELSYSGTNTFESKNCAAMPQSDMTTSTFLDKLNSEVTRYNTDQKKKVLSEWVFDSSYAFPVIKMTSGDSGSDGTPGGNTGDTDAGVLQSVRITPASDSLAVGDSSKVVATCVSDKGNILKTPTVTFASDNPAVAIVDAQGNVTAVAEGTANIRATATLGSVTVTSAEATVITVSAAQVPDVPTLYPNPLAVTGKTATVKAKTLKKKAVKLPVSKVLKIENAVGSLSFKKKSGDKRFVINKSSGKVTIKKTTGRGTYSIKVSVTAAGTAEYASKTVVRTFSIRVA